MSGRTGAGCELECGVLPVMRPSTGGLNGVLPLAERRALSAVYSRKQNDAASRFEMVFFKKQFLLRRGEQERSGGGRHHRGDPSHDRGRRRGLRQHPPRPALFQDHLQRAHQRRVQAALLQELVRCYIRVAAGDVGAGVSRPVKVKLSESNVTVASGSSAQAPRALMSSGLLWPVESAS